MIYKALFLLILFVSAVASQRLDFSSKNSCKTVLPPEEYKHIPLYTLQIFSTKTISTAQEVLDKLPTDLKKEVKLYKAGNYIASRYSKASNPKALKRYVDIFKNYGFNDAYIVKTTKWHMLRNYIAPAVRTAKKEVRQPLFFTKEKTLSPYEISQTIVKADRAYKNGNDSMAMLYYEMLLNANAATSKIKNNLCYLYGKRGAWFEAKKIIDKERYIPKLLYAYAYGALETNQPDFIQSLGKYILMDRSGRLALLSGAYYEKRGDFNRALNYYRLAYKKNPSDVYNIFAYARALDLNKNYKKALQYYKETLKHTHKKQELYATLKRRTVQLSEMLQ